MGADTGTILRCLLLLGLFLLSGPVKAQTEVNPVTAKTIDKNNFLLIVDGSEITVNIRDRVLLSKQAMLLEWVAYSARVVSHYYGRFPVGKLLIRLEVSGGFAVRFGQAFGGSSPHLRIVIGENINPDMLLKDWIMVHEMVHLAMADIPQSSRWLLEGLSTYVESIARAQTGYLSEEFVWNGFINRMPQGLPVTADEGLDYTPTWGRTYWGGAMFCMLADIEIRKLTNNKMSLRDALRGILNDGYSMQANAMPMQVFESGDAATGVPVLVTLYKKMRADPVLVDLPALWVELGVALENDQIVYNPDASLASVRKQLLKP
jgi:hypothetical protein